MTSAPVLLPLSPVHAAVLAALHPQGFEEPWSEKTFQDLLNLAHTWGWIAVDQAQTPLGFVLCQGDQVEAEILTIMVAPSFQRQGIAQTLIAKTRSQTTRLFLEVADDNPSALAFYKMQGFNFVGLRKNYYKRGNEDSIHAHIMQVIEEN